MNWLARTILCVTLPGGWLHGQALPSAESVMLEAALERLDLRDTFPVGIEPRFWNALESPGRALPRELFQLFQERTGGDSARLENVLDCLDAPAGPSRAGECRLQGGSALLLLSEPVVRGDTVWMTLSLLQSVALKPRITFLHSMKWRAVREDGIWRAILVDQRST